MCYSFFFYLLLAILRLSATLRKRKSNLKVAPTGSSNLRRFTKRTKVHFSMFKNRCRSLNDINFRIRYAKFPVFFYICNVVLIVSYAGVAGSVTSASSTLFTRSPHLSARAKNCLGESVWQFREISKKHKFSLRLLLFTCDKWSNARYINDKI